MCGAFFCGNNKLKEEFALRYDLFCFFKQNKSTQDALKIILFSLDANV